jgi:hypothetical protein
MSLSITQNPATASLAQSPMIFTLSESGNVVLSSSFQYYADLYYWTGSTNQSSSVADYQLVKYPNASLVGIFDVSKILNSTLTDLRQTNPSNVKYYKIDGYSRYLSGSVYVTSSHIESNVYKALDGYSVFQEQINGPIYGKSPFWPMMTDGPVTQSFFPDNTGTMGVYTQGAGSASLVPTKVTYTSNLGSSNINVSGSVSSSQQIQQVPLFPTETGFPFATSVEWYTIQAYSGSTALGNTIRYESACQQKYPNVRIKWKNRYGQFDYFNFYMVNKKSFKTEKRTYQPQIGTWGGATLSYNNYDSQTLNYLVDSNQAMLVNTFWIPEAYNDLIKQLMVSDEIYYVTTESNDTLTPITIDTSTIEFKTGVVDGLIQYSFEFRYGQGYKLII